MRKRKNSIRKIKPPSNAQQAHYDVPPFHETFPLKLTHKEDLVEKYCYFTCEEHLQTYIKRSKLKKNQIKIEKTQPRPGDS
jgi:hypothetical protein